MRGKKVYHSLEEMPPAYVPLDELRASHAADAAWFEKHLGPEVPAQLLRPGRPRKGAKTEPTKPHSVRIEDTVWSAVAKKAERLGISVNAAIRQAALIWAQERRS